MDAEVLTVIRLNDTGPAVARLQLAIGVDDDGIFGPLTCAALMAFQQGEGLPPTGEADDLTLAALFDETRPDTAPAHTPPMGVGMFVSAMRRSTCGTPQSMAAKAKAHGIKWVAACAIFQGHKRSDEYNGKASDYVSALKDEGVKVWVWGFPRPDGQRVALDVIEDRATRWGVTGVILDPEAPYYNRPSAARALLSDAVERFHAADLPVYVSSYGMISYHPRFPWEVLLIADGGIPQVYDGHNTMGKEYPNTAVRRWQGLMRGKPVVPAFATYRKTPGQFRAHLASMPPTDALIGWQWRTTKGSEWAELQKLSGGMV